MSDIAYDSANGENIYTGAKDLKTPNDQYDATVDSNYLWQATDAADVRDAIQYMRGSTIIGNAKKIQGVDVDATTAASPSDGDILQYDSGDGEWKAQPVDVTNVDYLNFSPQGTPPSELEGRVFFDDNKQNLVVYNDATETAHDLGRELRLSRAYNNTGSPITNGQVVYISGASGSSPEVSLAVASSFDTSRVIAMCTQASVADGTLGEFTTFGCVGSLDTSSYSAGDKLYLSPTTAGAFTSTMPGGEYFACTIGTVVTSDASDGKVFFSPNTPDLAAEVTRNKGFPSDYDTEATLSFVDGTRTFSITPTGTDFHFYQEGIQYRITSADDLVIADTDGIHFIYYDGSTLSESVNPSDAQIEAIILNKTLVATVYWNSTESTATIVAEERHKAQTMDGFTPRNHLYTHVHKGAQYTSGFTPNTVGTGGDGSSNAHAQFGIGSGVFDDEDLTLTADAIVSTTGCRYMYRSGASGYWTYGTNAGYSFPVGATPLPQYNENTGSTWQLTELTSGYYMLLHVFGVNSIDSTYNTICVLGQNQYSLIGSAQTAAEDDILNFSRGANFPFQEFTPIATFILEAKTSFTNTPQARLVVNGDGNPYTDFRGYSSGVVSGGGGGGTTPPGGSNGQIQYNDGGAFGGSSAFTFDDLTNTVAVTNITAASGTQTFSNVSITGGTIDGPSIGSTTEATIDHDALANYVANDHIDHSGVDITGGVGLTGGGAITLSRSIDLDVNGLTGETTVDGASDYLVMYDTSAGAHRKVLPDSMGYAALDGATFTGAVVIPSGTINNAVIGGTTAAAATFTSVTLGGQPVTDILTSSDGSSTSNSALVTAGYVDAHATAGDVAGPGSSTDNAISTFDGTGGDTIQNTGLSIIDGTNQEEIKPFDDVTATSIVGGIGSSSCSIYVYGNSHASSPGDINISSAGAVSASSLTLSIPGATSSFLVNGTGGSNLLTITASDGNAEFTGDVKTNNLPAPNLLINADGSVNQRGVADSDAVTTGDYLVDRHYATHDCTSVQVDIGSDGSHGIIIVTAGSGTSAQYAQKIEDYDKLQGLEVTLTAGVVSDNAADLIINDGVGSTTSSTSHTGGGTEETLTVTRTINGSATQVAAILDLVVGDSNYARIVWWKLEVGSVSTPFVADLPSVNLAKCQRYFQRIKPNGTGYGSLGYGLAYNTTSCSITLPLPNPMRSTVTLAQASGITGRMNIYSGSSAYSLTSVGIDNNLALVNEDGNLVGVGLNIGGSTGLTANAPAILRFVAGVAATDYLDLNAEL